MIQVTAKASSISTYAIPWSNAAPAITIIFTRQNLPCQKIVLTRIIISHTIRPDFKSDTTRTRFQSVKNEIWKPKIATHKSQPTLLILISTKLKRERGREGERERDVTIIGRSRSWCRGLGIDGRKQKKSREKSKNSHHK